MSLTEYEIGRILGKGRYGTVYLCRHKVRSAAAADNLVALKVQEEDARTEIELHAAVSFAAHLNIVALKRSFFVSTIGKHVMELEFVSGGDLFDYMQSKGGSLDEIEAASFIKQITNALVHCHSLLIVHRDVKPENILLADDKKTVKLCDFGAAARFDPTGKIVHSDRCGTPAYSCPEVLNMQPQTLAVDRWCLGILCFDLLFGRSPFYADNVLDIYTNVAKGTIHFPTTGMIASAPLQQLVRGLVRADAAKRWPLSRVLASAWLELNT